MYVDNVTIWTARSSHGEQQDALQAAADGVTEYANECSLERFPAKIQALRPQKKVQKINHQCRGH